MLNLLRGEPAAAVTDAPAARPAARLRVAVAWRPAGPVMVKAGFDGITADVLPLVSALHGGVAPVLPGSSVKGALRSRAEQIVRTLRGLSAGDDALENLDVPLVTAVFGSRGGRGAVSVADCYATTPIPTTAWTDVAAAGDEPGLRAALTAAGRADWQQAFHVAVDRWTGGAAEGMLYTVLEPHGTAWEPRELDIDAARAGDAGVALLLLVLRDLAAGRVPLGFGVNRGMGAVAVTGVTLGGAPFDLSDVPARFKIAWKAWVEAPAQGVPA